MLRKASRVRPGPRDTAERRQKSQDRRANSQAADRKGDV